MTDLSPAPASPAPPSLPPPQPPPSPSGWNPLSLVWLASAWIALAANWPLWNALDALPEMATPRGRLFMAAMCAMVMACTALLLTAAAWRRTVKPAVGVFLLAAAAGAHFMGTYNVVIDATMMVNVLQTDVRETRDLLSLRFLASMLFLAVLPLALLWRLPPQRLAAWRQVKRNALGLLGAAALLGALLLVFFADMSATMRNHKPLRYLINPLNSFYALGALAVEAQAAPEGPPLAVGADAQATPRAAGRRPALLVLVVGETARADHFALNGYARPTNPDLSAREVVSFRDVTSCGTSTATSLPCMFSVFGKQAFESESHPHENLLDVLQRAGLAVLWLDNQGGCKGVCARVENAFANAAPPGTRPPAPPLCDGEECLDEALLHGLDARLDALPAERRERGTVIVLHQMGSHGPAYWKRSPAGRKPFKPECETSVLQQCDKQALVNAYDNSIAYTDHLLGRTVDWLQKQSARHDAMLLYVSDHGESLGENNLYLHGLPYAFAPREQKHVPMVVWLSAPVAAALKPGCLAARRDQPLSHDHLSHTVMGLMGVRSSIYRATLDAVAPCRPA